MNDSKKRIRLIVYSGVIAALYVVLTLPIAQFAFGPVQFRLAESLTILPVFAFGYIPGLSLGCFLANLLNPSNLGPVDIIGGTAATLIAGFLSRILGKKNKFLGIIPPILVNGLIVGGYLPFLLLDKDSEITAAAVGISMAEVAVSEAIVVIAIGLPLMFIIMKTPALKSLIERVN
ncbi:MAG: QueT transporter family protein [Clostridiales bacterium]|nr:QueT transporter family protein [Clostridiales bacterium]